MSVRSATALLPVLRGRRFSRAISTSLALAVTISLILFLHAGQSRAGLFFSTLSPWPQNGNNQAIVVDEAASQLARSLGSIFESFAPLGTNNTDWPEWQRQNAIFQDRWTGLETADLWDTIQLDASKLLRMRDAHAGFLDAMTESLPTYKAPRSRPRGMEKGIVTVGGGRFFPPLLVSLRILRRTGTTLPVEVFVPQEEYEQELCENALAELGATCRIFPDIPPLKLGSFQFKVFAVLFSAFDNVLLLDADDFPVDEVEPLFSSQPFRQTGMIVWPDFWSTAVSPLYYLVTAQQPLPISERPKSETGQLLISKARHWQTLLLSAYYNYYPDVYYPLLCQGCIGCGDSETFLPAADLLDLPYYYVKTPPLHVGHELADGGVQGHVIAQYSPIHDFIATQKIAATRPASERFDLTTLEGRKPLRDIVSPLFMHTTFPKWDAYVLLDHVSQWSDMTKDIHGQPAAAFQEPVEEAARIRGVERMAWEEATWVVCNLGSQVRHWNGAGKTSPEKICERLTAYIRDTLDGEVGARLGLGPDDVVMSSRQAEIKR